MLSCLYQHYIYAFIKKVLFLFLICSQCRPFRLRGRYKLPFALNENDLKQACLLSSTLGQQTFSTTSSVTVRWWHSQKQINRISFSQRRCPVRGGSAVVNVVSVLLLILFISTSFQSPFSGQSQPAKHNARRTLRGAAQGMFGAAEDEFEVVDANEKSYFEPWIKQDFAQWEKTGIKMVRCKQRNLHFDSCTWCACLDLPCQALFLLICYTLLQSAVTEMALRYRECFGEVFRFQIINGTLWVDHISERHSGWYPSRMGAGKRLQPLVAWQLSLNIFTIFSQHIPNYS
jgi:hypothetical protein